MDPNKLSNLIDEIDKSGAATSLINKLSEEFDISEAVVKSSLKMFIMMINGLSKK